MSEDRVLEALKALRDADRECEAGPEVEIRLMQAVRRRRVRHQWMGAGALVASMAAAAAVVILLHAWREEPVRKTPAPRVVAVAPAAPQALGTAPQALGTAIPAPLVAVSRPKPKPARPRVWNLHEIDTDFYPLMELAPPFERGELVRVTVPASTMQDVGLYVSASQWDQPVQADVLVGQEGLARAIRFVIFE